MHVTRLIFFSRILRSEALVYKSFFFSEELFYGNYSTLDSHTNTVISHAFFLLVKMASKTVTRSITTPSVSSIFGIFLDPLREVGVRIHIPAGSEVYTL